MLFEYRVLAAPVKQMQVLVSFSRQENGSLERKRTCWFPGPCHWGVNDTPHRLQSLQGEHMKHASTDLAQHVASWPRDQEVENSVKVERIKVSSFAGHV